MSNDDNRNDQDPPTVLDLDLDFSGPDSETEVSDDAAVGFSRSHEATRKYVEPERPSHKDDIAAAIEEVEAHLVSEAYAKTSSEPQLGDSVGGRYQIESIVSGSDFVVLHTGVHQHFALRLISEWNDSVESRLRRVSKVASLLAHESLGFVTDVGICPRFGPFVVSEYVDGVNIRTLLDARDQWELEDALDFTLQVGSALASMHEIEVAHGLMDLDDILRSSDGRWKLVRPGVPPARDADQTHLPPNEPEPTAARDQYALANVLYSILVGAGPEGADPFPPSDLRTDLPMEIDDVLLKALAHDPSERWEQLDDLIQGVQAAIKVWFTPTVDPFDAREASRIQRAAILKPRTASSRKAAALSSEDSASAEAEQNTNSELVVSEAAVHEHPPVDLSKASVLENTGFAGPGVRKASVVVRFADISNELSRISVAFQSAARLRREYRRNILAGGLFVPMLECPTPPQRVVLELFFAPTERSFEVEANVVSVTAGTDTSPSGAGLMFDPLAHDRVLEFLRSLNLGLGNRSTDTLIPLKPLLASDDIGAAEAFLLSRLVGEPTIGSMRALFADLPFDFDDALGALLESGHLRVHQPQTPKLAGNRADKRPSLRPRVLHVLDEVVPTLSTEEFKKQSAPDTPEASVPNKPKAPERSEPDVGPESIRHTRSEVDEIFGDRLGLEISLATASMAYEALELSSDDEEKVIQVVEYFEDRLNYLAAINVLEKALEHSSKNTTFMHRLALLQGTFQNNLVAAIRTINHAVRLDPRDKALIKGRNYIKDLQNADARRPVFSQAIRAKEVRFLRVDPELDRVWVETVTQKPVMKKIYGVDYRNRALHGIMTAAQPKLMVAIPGNHPRFSLFHSAPPGQTVALQQKRSILLKRAQSSSDYGPWYCEAHPPLAWLPNSEYFVVDRLIHSLEEGLFMVSLGKSSIHLSPSTGRSTNPKFSPDEKAVAWSNPKSNRGVWAAQLLQASEHVFPTTSEVLFEWDARSQGVYVVDRATGTFSFGLLGGDVSEILELKRPVDFLVTDAAHKTFLLATNQDGQCLVEWIQPEEQNHRTSYVLDQEVREIALREDGLLFAASADSCVGADMKKQRQYTLEGLELNSGCLTRNSWLVGKPLVVATASTSQIEILSLHVSMLVNS